MLAPFVVDRNTIGGLMCNKNSFFGFFDFIDNRFCPADKRGIRCHESAAAITNKQNIINKRSLLMKKCPAVAFAHGVCNHVVFVVAMNNNLGGMEFCEFCAYLFNVLFKNSKISEVNQKVRFFFANKCINFFESSTIRMNVREGEKFHIYCGVMVQQWLTQLMTLSVPCCAYRSDAAWQERVPANVLSQGMLVAQLESGAGVVARERTASPVVDAGALPSDIESATAEITRIRSKIGELCFFACLRDVWRFMLHGAERQQQSREWPIPPKARRASDGLS